MLMHERIAFGLPFLAGLSLAVALSAGCTGPRGGGHDVCLRPDEVLVVVNDASPESVVLGDYYLKRRKVPAANLCRIHTVTGFHVTRAEYDMQIAAPIRDFLDEHGLAGRIRCLALMWGVPVKIGAQPRPEAPPHAPPPEYPDAAVDNELALLWHGGYEIALRQPNPLYGPAATNSVAAPRTLMAARLDGPTATDARRLLDDALAAEAEGLDGTLYLDAGGAYPWYDAHFRALAALMREHGRLPVVLDEAPTLFPAGACPDAALYAGWYAYKRADRHIDAFTWKRGAVAYHIASFEASELRDPASKTWCNHLIRAGVAATFGPVSEPHLEAFPLPEEFWPLLLTGRWTLAECYWRTLPHASWQMTLIGDPLYRPFMRRPGLAITGVPPGLAPPAVHGGKP
jgi:uncharacterized protein (TIGR03790 family)